jgi:hypothetical protein
MARLYRIVAIPPEGQPSDASLRGDLNKIIVVIILLLSVKLIIKPARAGARELSSSGQASARERM